MSMTPSRRTLERITLGDLAADHRLMIVKCARCSRTSYFVAADLAKAYGAQIKMHEVFHQCSRCGRSDMLHVSTRLPDPADHGVLKVRRPRWAWREVLYESPIKRPQTASEAIARSRSGGTGMGHNHEEPYTVEQSSIMSRLSNKGFWPSNFATRAERVAWLEENRWRVDPDAPRPRED